MKTIAHIGFGAFHRAHQLVYGQELADNDNFPWRYICVNLNSSRDITLLREQNLRFSVLQRDDNAEQVCDVNIVQQALHPEIDGLDYVLKTLSQTDVTIISLTVTEKAYAMKQGFQFLDEDFGYIRSDIQNPFSPRSVVSVLANVLYRRMIHNAGGVSLLSCDNIPQNGHVLKSALEQYIRKAYADTVLLDWISEHVSFPSSMVDRIVPAMNSEARHLLEHTLGHSDACGVVCENFKQWVIEDNFINGRPQWESVGCLMVDVVAPYEMIKLRLLNGAHSWIAYIGTLAGCETVAEVMAIPVFQQAVKRLMLDEQSQTVDIPSGFELSSYADSLLHRFMNGLLRHKTSQIAMDGSQKISQRWLLSLKTLLENERVCPMLEIGIAAWLIYLSGRDLGGNEIDFQDPQKDYFRKIYKNAQSTDTAALTILSEFNAFECSVFQQAEFQQRILKHCQGLRSVGIEPYVANILETIAS
ncbi:Polyol:NADP oxidoreductase [Thalassocella blandensis]|nr:Polyol:NADP oxidoreductase [Thalassocella blandensis]